MVQVIRHTRSPRISWLVALLGVALTLMAGAGASADTNYGRGTYGSCQYGSCSITLSSSGLVNLNITPTTSGSCSVQSDNVSVLTDNSAGYSLTLNDNSASSSLANGGNTIGAVNGSLSSPASLAMNRWGYRVDGAGGFGAGPTAAQSSGTTGLSFAALPTNAQTADTLADTSGPADPAVVTPVWYGVCSDLKTPAGTYTTQVVYTATVN